MKQKQKASGKQLYRAAQTLFKTNYPTTYQLTYILNHSNPVNYALAYHTANNHPITFDIPNYNYAKAVGHRPWQKEILEANCDIDKKEVVTMKSRQLGMSEVGVMVMFYLCDVYSFDGLRLAYAFPTIRQIQDFKKSRIDNQITSGYYQTLIDKYNNSQNQMSIRDSRVFFRTASKPDTLEGLNLNVIMYDEYERYAGSASESSGEGSLKGDNKYALVRRWSTPSAPDFGTDKKYKASDQRVWLIKCEHCGYEQEMDFKKNIEIVDEDGIDTGIGEVKPGSTRYVCQKCHQNLEASRWYNGRWVAKYPSRSNVGFFVSQLNAVWLTSDQVYSDSLNANSRQLFYNYTLGKPYQDTSLVLTSNDILNNMRPDLPTDQTIRGDYSLISVGIDWGQHYHHVVVLGCRANGIWDVIHLQRIVKSNGVEHLEEDLRQIIMLLNQFDPDIILPDIG